jgi:putative transposase
LAVTYLQESFGLKISRACGLVSLWRSSLYYNCRDSSADERLRQRLKELSEQRRRFGCLRLHVLLKREGLVINHKRTERIYREERLSLKLRKRRKRAGGIRIQLPRAERLNQRWSMDFIHESLWTGRKFRALTIVDDYSKECPRIEVDSSLTGARVSRVLDQLSELRGLPETITVDNGPEFSGQILDEWAYRKGVKLNFIEPGKPTQNAYIESFNGKFRDECLNENWFSSMEEARDIIEMWRQDYNEVRPHSSLGNLTPKEFAEKQTTNMETLTLQPVQSLG